MAPLKPPGPRGAVSASSRYRPLQKVILMIVRKRPWSDADVERLAAIVTAGGTPIRAAAALKRRIASCQLQARKMGTPFTLKHIIRKQTKLESKRKQSVRQLNGSWRDGDFFGPLELIQTEGSLRGAKIAVTRQWKICSCSLLLC